MCNEHGVTIMTSKSSFLSEEPERRISRGYCRGYRPRNAYIYIYIYIKGTFGILNVNYIKNNNLYYWE